MSECITYSGAIEDMVYTLYVHTFPSPLYYIQWNHRGYGIYIYIACTYLPIFGGVGHSTFVEHHFSDFWHLADELAKGRGQSTPLRFGSIAQCCLPLGALDDGKRYSSGGREARREIERGEER